MIGRVGIDARSNPWSRVPERDYPSGFMDESLAILRRIALVQTNPRLEPVHCEAIARALTEADAECAGGRSMNRSKRVADLTPVAREI